MTTNKGLSTPAGGTLSWDSPLNSNFDIIDKALGSALTIAVGGVVSSPVTLTSTQYQNQAIIFSGVMGIDITYRIPSGIGGSWIIINNTTGGKVLTIANVAGGTSVVVPSSTNRTVYSDGTNIVFADSAVVSPGSTTQVIFNDGGALAGDAGMVYDKTTDSLTLVGGLTVKAGSVSLPAVTTTGDSDTGIYFPAANTVGITTGGGVKVQVNGSGSIAVNGTSYGNAGQVLSSNGNASPATWVGTNYELVNTLDLTVSTVLGSLVLTPYKFLRIVLDSWSHNSGSSQTFSIGNTSGSQRTISGSYTSATQMFGIIDIALLTADGVAMVSTGSTAGGSAYGSARNTGILDSTTSITCSVSGGSFDLGSMYVYGMR